MSTGQVEGWRGQVLMRATSLKTVVMMVMIIEKEFAQICECGAVTCPKRKTPQAILILALHIYIQHFIFASPGPDDAINSLSPLQSPFSHFLSFFKRSIFCPHTLSNFATNFGNKLIVNGPA